MGAWNFGGYQHLLQRCLAPDDFAGSAPRRHHQTGLAISSRRTCFVTPKDKNKPWCSILRFSAGWEALWRLELVVARICFSPTTDKNRPSGHIPGAHVRPNRMFQFFLVLLRIATRPGLPSSGRKDTSGVSACATCGTLPVPRPSNRNACGRDDFLLRPAPRAADANKYPAHPGIARAAN